MCYILRVKTVIFVSFLFNSFGLKVLLLFISAKEYFCFLEMALCGPFSWAKAVCVMKRYIVCLLFILKGIKLCVY
jgi:hypothetical protein